MLNSRVDAALEGNGGDEAGGGKWSHSAGRMLGKVGGAYYGVKTTATSVAGAAASTAKDVALVAGAEATSKAYNCLSEEKRQQVSKGFEYATSTGKAVVTKGCTVGAEVGSGVYEGWQQQKQQIDLQKEAMMEKAYAMLPEHEREILLNAKKTLADKKAGIVEEAKAYALDWSEPMLDRLLDRLRDKILMGLLADPAMFDWIRRRVKWAFSGIWEEIRYEVHLLVKTSVLKTEEYEEGPPPKGCYGPIRAWFLYHLYPYDKSVFGIFRDPVALFFKLLMCIPVFGVRTFFFALILCFITTGTPKTQKGGDEYQLISFILQFKGMQFFSGGVLNALLGAAQYYVCINKGTCIGDISNLVMADSSITYEEPKGGPGQTDGLYLNLLDFLLNVALVWLAFLMLPFSEKHGGASFQAQKAQRDRESDDEEYEKELCCTTDIPCCSIKYNTSRGGRMLDLLKYDLIAFSLGIAAIICMEFWQSGQLNSELKLEMLAEEIYWGRVVYALFSFPFLLFIIPGVKRLLTHSVTTGYTRNGYVRTVKIGKSSGESPESGRASRKSNSSPGKKQTSVKSV